MLDNLYVVRETQICHLGGGKYDTACEPTLEFSLLGNYVKTIEYYKSIQILQRSSDLGVSD